MTATEATVVHRPRARAVLGRLAAAAACAAGALFLATELADRTDGGGNARTTGRATLLLAFLAVAAVGLTLMALSSLRTPHCSGCREPVDHSAGARAVPTAGRAELLGAFDRRDWATVGRLSTAVVGAGTSHLVVGVEGCRGCGRTARVEVRTGGTDKVERLRRPRNLSAPEVRALGLADPTVG